MAFPALLLFMIVALFAAATLLGRANRNRKLIKPFVKSAVRVEVWGAPLVGTGEVFEVESVLAFGVGLLIRLRPAAGGRAAILKVAQPSVATVERGRVAIGTAAYVSWGGVKIKRAAGAVGPAVVMRCAEVQSRPSVR